MTAGYLTLIQKHGQRLVTSYPMTPVNVYDII